MLALPGQPNVCLPENRYQASGPHTVTWAGVTPAGAFREDIQSIAVVTERKAFARNSVVVFGTSPRVENVRVVPPVYGPTVGSQDVTFDLTTFQNQPFSVQVRFFDQASQSHLRTITIPGQAPGAVAVRPSMALRRLLVF